MVPRAKGSCIKDPSLYPVSSIKDNSVLNYLCQSSFTNIYKRNNDNGLAMLNERRIILSISVSTCLSLCHSRGEYTLSSCLEQDDWDVLKSTAYPFPGIFINITFIYYALHNLI